MKQKIILSIVSLSLGFLLGTSREHQWWIKNPSQSFSVLARELEKSPYPRDKYLSAISWAISASSDMGNLESLWNAVKEWSEKQLRVIQNTTNSK